MGSCYSSHNARLATLPSDLLPFDKPCTAAPTTVNLSLASSEPIEIVRQSELEKSQPDLLQPLSPPPLPYSRPSCLVPSHRTVPDHLIPFTRAPIQPSSSSVASTGPGPARSIVRTINQSIVVPSKVCRFELPVAVKLQAPVPTTVCQPQQQPRNFGKKAPIPTPRYSPKRLQQAKSGNLPGHSPSRALVVPPPSVVNRVVQLYQVSFVDSNSIELTNISESEDIASSSTSTPCHPKPAPKTSPKKKNKKKKSPKSAGLSHLLTVARHQRALRQSQPSFLDQLKERSVRLLQIARPKSNSSGMSHPFSSSSSKVHPGGSQLKPPQAAYQSSRPVGKQQPPTTRNNLSSQDGPNPGPKPAAAKSSGLRMPTAFSTMFGASRLPLSSSKSIGNVSSTTNTPTDHHHQLTPVNSICSSLSGSSPSVDSSSRHSQSNSHRSSSRSRLPSARNTASPTDPKFLKSSSSSNLPATTTTVPVSLFSAKPNPKVNSTTTANKSSSKSQPQGTGQSQASKPVPSQIKSPVVVSSSSSSSTGPELPPRHAQVPPPLPLKSQQYQNQRLNFLFGSIATTAETTTTTTTNAFSNQQSPSRTQPVNNVVPSVRQHQAGPRVATIARPVQISQLQRNSNLPGASRLKSPSLVNSELKQSSCPYKRPHSQQQPTPVSSFLMGSQPVNHQQQSFNHSAGPNYYNFVRNAVTRLNGTGTSTEPTQATHHPGLVKTRLAGPRPRQLEMVDSNGGNFDNMAGSRKAIVAQSDSQILSERLANSCSLRSQPDQQQSAQPVPGYQLTYSKRTRPIGTLTNSLATNTNTNTNTNTTTTTSTQSTRNRLSVTRTNNGGNSGGDDIGGDAPSQAASAASSSFARQVVLAGSTHLAINNNANCYEDKKEKNNSRDNDSGTGLMTGVMDNNSSSSCPNSPQRHPNLLRPFLLEQAQTAPGSPRLTTTATNNNINWHHQYSPNRSSGSGNSASEQTENWLGSPQAKQSQQQQQQQPYDTDEDINTLSSCSSAASSSTPANNQPVDPTGQLTASCCSTASTASSFYFEQGFYTSGKNFGPEAQRPGTNTTASSTSQDSVSNRDLFLIDDEIADQPDLQFQMMMSPATTTARSTNTRPLYLDLASRNVPSSATSASTPSAGPDSPSSAQSSLTPTNPNSQQSNRSHSSQRRLSQSQSVPGESMLRSIHDELYSLISSNNNQSGREAPSSGQLLNEFASLPSDCLVTSDICDYSSSGLGDEHSVPSSPKAQGPRVRGSASLRKRHSYTASNSGPVFRRPRPLSFVENDDGSFGLDSSSFRAVSQDMMGIKTLLFRLQGVLQNAPTQSPFETSTGTGTSSHYSNRSSLDSLPSSDRLSIGSIYSDPNHHLSSTATADELVPILRQENFDLQQHIQLLEQQLTDKDRTIRLLQQQMSKYAGRHCLVVHPSQRHSHHRQSQQSQSVNLTNSTTQTEQCSNSINPRALSDGSDGGQLVRFCCSHEMDLV